jgi:hypothetical protein
MCLSSKSGELFDLHANEYTVGNNAELRSWPPRLWGYIMGSDTVKLRSTPTVLSEASANAVVERIDGLHCPFSPNERFARDSSGGAIIDRWTRLMWLSESSPSTLSFIRARDDYLVNVNRSRAAGYNDWRIPTLEELYSISKHWNRSSWIFPAPPNAIWTIDRTDRDARVPDRNPGTLGYMFLSAKDRGSLWFVRQGSSIGDNTWDDSDFFWAKLCRTM